MPEHKTFNCVIIAPSGKLLDCRTPSVIFPAHDGQVGIWCDHIPMFCRLGLGIMEVKAAIPTAQTNATEKDYSLLIDGGFAFVCKNQLKVTSYDVVIADKESPQAVEQLLAGINKRLAEKTIDRQNKQHLVRKAAFLTALVRK